MRKTIVRMRRFIPGCSTETGDGVDISLACAPWEVPSVPEKVGTCSYPGCDVALGSRNKSGVCVRHVHGPTCQCLKCIWGARR